MRTARRGFISILIAASAFLVTPESQADTELFPRPASLEPAIRFWTRVYTEVDTSSGFIHDNLRMDVVYETARFGSNVTAQQRRRELDRKTADYRRILEKLASGARENLTAEERRVLELFPSDVSNSELRAATQRIRFQLGQSDRFRAGLIRAGEWKPYIYEVLRERGLPRELAVLPHVESSFDPTAYSRVGAAGMWQFIRSTGLRYMRIDHVVDERRDPYFSTHAAARLLEDNYAVLQHWPLAITAYNHGLGGMRRAVSQLGTTDMGVIVRSYSGRTFGFASRNFYTAFLAALDVDSDPERYFGPVTPNRPADLVVTRMPSYMTVATLAEALQISQRELRRYNPALSDIVWREEKYVPRGFELRVPRRSGIDVVATLAAVPATQAFAAQRPDVEHRVQPGDTLSQIAQRYRISLASLMEANNLRSRDFIRAGQVLTLPVPAGADAPMLAEAAEPAAAPLGAGNVYVVRTGDSLDRIARRFGVDQAALLAANDIRNRNRIYAGQELRIPTGEPASPRGQAVLAAAAADDDPPVVTAALLVEPPAAPVEAPRSAPRRDPGPEPELEAELALAAAEPAPAPAEDQPSDLDSNVLASIQADLAADPSDYTVAGDGTIEVQALETLGHYADWLGLATQRLRDINGLPFQRALVLGQRLQLDFSRVDRATFERRRTAYHQELQESFFARYHIEDIDDHVVRRGESLWVLAQRQYNVPVWLLRQYNPDVDLDRVSPGTVIKFPRLRPAAEGDAQARSPDQLLSSTV